MYRRPLPFMLWIAGVLVAVHAAARVAQGEPAAEDPAAALAAQRAEIAAQRALVHEHPERAELWEHLLALEGMGLMFELHATSPEGAVDPATATRRGEELRARLLAEWRAKRPQDAGPDLLAARLTPPGATRDELILAIAARFPDDPAAARQAGQVLRGRGESTKASELLTAYAERHPDDWRGRELLLEQLAAEGNRTAATELISAWLDLHPGDARAFEWLLGRTGGPLTVESRARLEHSLPALAEAPPSPELAALCQRLASYGDPSLLAFAEACAEKLVTAGDAALAEAGEGLFGRVLALAHDPRRTDERLARLAPGARLRMAVGYASQLAAREECDEAVRVLRGIVPLTEGNDQAFSAFAGTLSQCREAYVARELLVERAGTVPVASLDTLFSGWVWIAQGRYNQSLPTDRLAPLLEGRLASEGLTPELARALDRVYAVAGRSDQRAALLRRERAAGLWIDARRLAEVAGQEAEAGRDASAMALLESELAVQPANGAALRSFVELALAAGKLEPAGIAAERALAAAEDRWARGQAHWMLARVALARHDVGAARGHYRAALAESTDLGPVGREYLQLLAGLEVPANELVAACRELCAAAASGLRTSPDECVGGLLADELHRPELAEPLWEAALAKAPGNTELYGKVAQTLAARGELARAAGVLRQRIALDPKNEAAWAELGNLWLGVGNVAAHDGAVAEAERAMGAPVVMLLYQRADLAMRQGNPRRAVEALLRVKELQPQNPWCDYKLQQAYAALGGEKE